MFRRFSISRRGDFGTADSRSFDGIATRVLDVLAVQDDKDKRASKLTIFMLLNRRPSFVKELRNPNANNAGCGTWV